MHQLRLVDFREPAFFLSIEKLTFSSTWTSRGTACYGTKLIYQSCWLSPCAYWYQPWGNDSFGKRYIYIFLWLLQVNSTTNDEAVQSYKSAIYVRSGVQRQATLKRISGTSVPLAKLWIAMFVWLVSQPTTILFSHTKSASAVSYQPVSSIVLSYLDACNTHRLHFTLHQTCELLGEQMFIFKRN